MVTDRPVIRWLALTMTCVALAVVANIRVLGFNGSSNDALLMVLGVGLFLVVQVALLMVRADDVTRIIYGYLSTFYFGNRALAEVWLGPATEAGAGSVAPLMLGDFVLLEAVLRRRIGMPAGLFLFLALTLLPAANLLTGQLPGFDAGAFAYQYFALGRGALVAVVLIGMLRRSGRGAHRYLTHLGVIFGALGCLTALIAVVAGTRFGLPGWGVNVYANALSVVGAVCGWRAIHERQGRWLNVILLLGCAAGVVGSGTRLALLALIGVVTWSLVAVLLARRMPVFGHLSVGIAAGVVVIGFAGSLISFAGDINPRFATIGGTEVTHSTGPLEVLGAVQRESSVRTRMALWQASLAMFADRPVVGVGWGQWNWLKAQYGVEFDVLLDPHNGYLWALAEGGVVGLIVVYGGLLGFLLWLRPTLPLFGVLLALVLELSNANLQKPLFAVLIAILLALAWQATRDRAGASPPAPS